MVDDLSPVVSNLIDLAAKNMGGEVLFVSDDFFASKENLISDEKPSWDPELFTDTGKVYDGWESRRNRSGRNDWVIVKLAKKGSLSLVDVDTAHFLGNAPQFISIEGTDIDHITSDSVENIDWKEILPISSVRAGRQNIFVVKENHQVTHVRLQIYPDGGVARLRCYGVASLESKNDGIQDYASILNGGKAIVASDMFYGEMSNLLKPNIPVNMGDGWETKRRRGKGHDWVIIELGKSVIPKEIIVDTMHFKGNFPDYCEIDVSNRNDVARNELTNDENWTQVISNYKLQAHKTHTITDFTIDKPIKFIRLRIYPDGGLARLKVFA